jgi:hypothetical protein
MCGWWGHSFGRVSTASVSLGTGAARDDRFLGLYTNPWFERPPLAAAAQVEILPAKVWLRVIILMREKSGIDSDYEAKENDWRFIISPYAMLASQTTDGGGEQLRQSFSDLSSMTNFGFQVIAKVVYKKWVFTADGTYANLGSKSDQGPPGAPVFWAGG